MYTLIFALLTSVLGSDAQAACLEVTVHTTDATGPVLVGVYRPEDAFPRPGRHLVNASAPLDDGVATVRFEDLRPGAYALAAAVDENANGAVDLNFFGLPAEPVAFSLGARSSLFGPPKFAAAALEVADTQACQATHIRFD